jgi:uncharacterized protein YcaQ
VTEDDIKKLIEQSSLGTPEARAIRARTSPELARALVAASRCHDRAEAAEAELEALRGAARRLVIAAKEWTRSTQDLQSPQVRQAAVDELADAIDAFDPLLGETT